MNSNNLTSNNLDIGKIKKTLSKTGWLIALAIGVLGLALIFLSQAASAQSSVARVTFEQTFGDHDDDDGDTTTDKGYARVTVSVSGSANVLVPNADDGVAGYGNYPVVTVEDTDDCDEDAFPATGDIKVFAATAADGTIFDIQNRRGDNLRSSSHNFDTSDFTADDHHDKHLCVKVTYETDDSDEVEYVASSAVLDLEGPMIEEAVVNNDARNQEYGLGDTIDIVVEFSERVEIEKISDDTGDDLMRPYIDIGDALTGRQAELLSLGSGTTLTFRYTVQFSDDASGGDPEDLGEIEGVTIVLGNDYRIADVAGNVAALEEADEDIDFRGGEVSVELSVSAVRMGNKLVVEADPDKYETTTIRLFQL